MNCVQCGKDFTPKIRIQRFCSKDCRRYYFHHHETYHKENDTNAEIIRQFDCCQCKRLVLVTNKRDQRTVFCSRTCERNYWREVTKHAVKNRGSRNNQEMSGGMSLGSLIRRERRDLA